MAQQSVKLIEGLSPDLLVVNSARVSFGKYKEELDDKDEKLINYLAEHGHWSPFSHPRFIIQAYVTNGFFEHLLENRELSAGIASAKLLFEDFDRKCVLLHASLYALFKMSYGNRKLHRFLFEKAPLSFSALAKAHIKDIPDFPTASFDFSSELTPMEINDKIVAGGAWDWMLPVTFHMKSPILVARQLAKHQVGMSLNEISRRYVDFEPEFFAFEDGIRSRAANKKQGSGGDVDPATAVTLATSSAHSTQLSNAEYAMWLEAGVCPEQARGHLNQLMMTEWYWTGGLQQWARVVRQRDKEDVQLETRNQARRINTILEEKYGENWSRVLHASNA